MLPTLSGNIVDGGGGGVEQWQEEEAITVTLAVQLRIKGNYPGINYRVDSSDHEFFQLLYCTVV